MRSIAMSQKNRTPAAGFSAERTAHMVWRILRLDDNGNQFVVAECDSEDEARRIADGFSARGHKQAYWVECDGEDEERDGH
jgi:hypothetical protein